MTLRLIGLLLLFPAVLAADTYPRQPGIDGIEQVFPQEREAGLRLFEDTTRRALRFFVTTSGLSEGLAPGVVSVAGAR